MLDEVQARARTVFFDQRVHHTAMSSGVLLYVSLFERMATILADQSVLEKLGSGQDEVWCAELTGRLHAGPPVTALCETIRTVGQQLSTTVPRQEHDVNELSDALVLLD
jgi:putative membrane protein